MRKGINIYLTTMSVIVRLHQNLVIESLDAFKEFIRNDRKSIPDQKLNVKMLIAEGDLVEFWATYTGTQIGQMGPFPPTGKSVEIHFPVMCFILG